MHTAVENHWVKGISILEIEKLRQKELKQFSQHLTIRKWLSYMTQPLGYTLNH